MSNALFADISHFQVAQIGAAYWPWSKSGDGSVRLAFKVSEGVGYKDANGDGYWQQATAAQASMIACYHFARADRNPGAAGAANEAKWMASVVANRLRSGDRLMLDFEQNESAAWAHAFHDALVALYPRPEKLVLYDSASHFAQFFASDLSLAAKYDAAIAAWHPLTQGPPPVPHGWNMIWWQYADNESVPGIGTCDANVWLGGPPPPPPAPPVDFAKVKADLAAIVASAQDALKQLG